MDLKRLKELEEQAEEALRRDLRHIFTLVSSKKLDASSAKNLTDYIKLLHDMRSEIEREEAKAAKELGKLTDEQLEAEAQKLLNESKARNDSKRTVKTS